VGLELRLGKSKVEFLLHSPRFTPTVVEGVGYGLTSEMGIFIAPGFNPGIIDCRRSRKMALAILRDGIAPDNCTRSKDNKAELLPLAIADSA
jgi:hypothetical protein